MAPTTAQMRESLMLEAARETVWGQLAEGVFDPYILKAIFLAGGGGSGKGFISSLMFGTAQDMATTTFGIKSVNSDDLLTALTGNLPRQAKRAFGGVGGGTVFGRGLGGRAPIDISHQLGAPAIQRPGGIRAQAKSKAKARKGLFTMGRLGLIIDGTAANVEKLLKEKVALEGLGYDTYMVFVNTSLDVALERNAMRQRRVPKPLVIAAHAKVQAAADRFRQAFGRRFVMVDNSKRLADGSPEMRAKAKEMNKIARKFLSEPLRNPIGWEWLEQETAGMPPAMLKKVTWIGKKRGA